MIRFMCPTCQKRLKAPDEGAGQKTHCPRCGQRLYVPPPLQALARNKTITVQPTLSPPEWLDEVRVAEGKSKESSAPQQPSESALFKCPTCHTSFCVPKQMIGRMVNCPKCQATFAALADDDAQDNSGHQTTTATEAPLPGERGTDEKYCHECGAVIRARAEICPNCGVRQPAGLGYASSLEPHRGSAILVLGILGLVVFWPVGVIAWLWANEDLRKMDAGIMDPEGRGSTQAGRICGLIATVLALVAVGLIVLYLFMMFCMCGVLLPAPLR